MIGEQGVALIARVVLSMGHLWHATSGTDSGIDGEIELRDLASGTVRNVRIGVQSKATTGKWAGETPTEFSYKAKPADIDYWLSSNQPVLLVCSRPDADEIYWRSVQEWALDPVARASGLIRFDKARDRFGSATREQLFDLKATSANRVEPPGPAPVPEDVLTNLMPIAWRSQTLYSVAVPTNDARALFAPAHEAGVHDWSAVLRDGRLWSLTSFDDRFLAAIDASDETEQALGEFLSSDDRRDLNVGRELVRRSILASRRKWLLWHKQRHVAYFRCKPEEHAEVRYAWSTGRGRAVVSPRWAKGDEHFTGHRHDAAEFAVRRLDGEWFLQINPTYLFTWDGRQLSGHHDRALAGNSPDITRQPRRRAAPRVDAGRAQALRAKAAGCRLGCQSQVHGLARSQPSPDRLGRRQASFRCRAVYAQRMDILDALGLASRLWPRLVAVIVAATILLFPHTASGLFRDAVDARVAQVTALMENVLRPMIEQARRHSAAIASPRTPGSLGSNLGSKVSATQGHSAMLSPSNHGG